MNNQMPMAVWRAGMDQIEAAAQGCGYAASLGQRKRVAHIPTAEAARSGLIFSRTKGRRDHTLIECPVVPNQWVQFTEEARFDGIFVLRTNAKVTPLQAVLRYRDLLLVEDLFRRTKAIMRTRPIFHSSDAAIRGHVFCSFLALAMQKHLDDLLRQTGLVPEWKDLLRDLDRLAQARIRHRGADWLVRTDAAPAVTMLFKSVRIALPPRAHHARPPPPARSKSARNRRGRPRRSATPT